MSEQKRRLIHVLLTVAGSAVCAYFSIPCTVIAAVLSGAYLAFYERILARRRDLAMQLCDDIDRILRHGDRISFDEYKEGD